MISIIIPTYNHARYVCDALESVFSQNYTDYEVIVVNDGSPDNTSEILRPYIEKGRIRYVEQKNEGQAGARNRGLTEAKGEYIAYLDDDDCWFPEKLQWQHQFMEQHPEVVLVWGEVDYMNCEQDRIVREGNTEIFRDAHQTFLQCNRIHSVGQTLIRHDALAKIGGFDTEIWGSDDWDLYIRLGRIGAFAYRDLPSLHYRFHEGNASRSAIRHSRNHLKVMRKHMGGNLALMARHLRAASHYFVPNLLKASRAARSEQDYQEALHAQLHALVYRPTLLFQRTFLLPLGGNLLRKKPRHRS